MNRFTELAMSRRSIRQYKTGQIAKESLQAILKAGIYAPNGGNKQSWHFTVIQNQEILEELNWLVRMAYGKRAGTDKRYRKGRDKAEDDNYCFYYKAPTLIIISGDVTNPNATADCICAQENILLAAHAEGLGSVYVNQLTWLCDDPDIRKLLTKLGVPETYNIYASAAIGYSNEKPVKGVRNEDVVNYVR